MGLIMFNNVRSDSLGIQVSGRGTFNAPPKSYEMISIPHRNGDIIMDNDKFENIDVTYPVIFLRESYVGVVRYTYAQNKIRVRQWLNSAKGYATLSDSYNPGEYRLACFKEAVDITDYYFEAGAMDITFNCRPERFLISGDTPISITGGFGTITNEQIFASKPLIKIYGYGTVNIGDVSVTVVSSPDAYTMIDCDQMQCYFGDTNKNLDVQIDEFPTLKPGDTTISWSGNTITKVDITPRWWRI